MAIANELPSAARYQPRLSPSRHLPRSFLAFGGVLVGLLMAEVCGRLAGVQLAPKMRNRVFFEMYDPVLGWGNRPGAGREYSRTEFHTHVSINADGFRGPLVPLERTPNVERVALLGDSQTWGDGVSDDETYASLLLHDDREVLNFSAPGYGTDQELLLLERNAAAYHPDVVVLAMFVGNDFRDNASSGSMAFRKPFFELTSGEKLVLRGVPVPYSPIAHSLTLLYREVMMRSVVLNAIAHLSELRRRSLTQALPARVSAGRPPQEIYEAKLDSEVAASLRLTSALVKAVIQRTRQIGARPLVLLLPERWQLDVAAEESAPARLALEGILWRQPQDYIIRTLRSERVAVIDALPALSEAEKQDAQSLVMYRRWGHLTAAGHRVVAGVVGNTLERGASVR